MISQYFKSQNSILYMANMRIKEQYIDLYDKATYHVSMTINEYSPLDGVKKELAKRFKTYRLSLNMSQLSIAEKSGVSLGVIKSFERSGTVSLLNLLKLLKSVSLLSNVDSLIPLLAMNAVEVHELGHQRQRARRKGKPASQQWGDEQ